MVMRVRTSDIDGYDDPELYGWADAFYSERRSEPDDLPGVSRQRVVRVKAKVVVPPPPKPKRFNGGISVSKKESK